jgi:hypothetical protein
MAERAIYGIDVVAITPAGRLIPHIRCIDKQPCIGLS